MIHIDNYLAAVEYFSKISTLGSVPGLDSTVALLEASGNPEFTLPIIHIAGTNGKGSTACFISNILTAQGYVVGTFISPWKNKIEETIQVNGICISDSDFTVYTEKIANFRDSIFTGRHLIATEFETAFVMALLYFKDIRCDYVVIEVGMGGRIDATNAVERTLISVITEISYDHMNYLGNDLTCIAYEKCGIIKCGGIVVSYPAQIDEVKEAIALVSDAMAARTIYADLSLLKIKSESLEETIFDYGELLNLKIRLPGRHQVLNAITAIETVFALRNHLNAYCSDEAIVNGLYSTRLKGRLEIIGESPLTIFDVAHNYSGICALRAALQLYFTNKKIIIVMGVLADKEYEKCVEELSKVSDILIGVTPDNSRALSAAKLVDVASGYFKEAICMNRTADARAYAKSIADEETVICICGSHYN